jgi:RNA polymerase sigma-70 factor (ECF subfamily)
MFLGFFTLNTDEALYDDLLARARQLDSSVLAEIHDRYYPEVYRFVSFRLADSALSEDIAAEVFLRLVEGFAQKKGPDRNLRGWLLGVASNLVNDDLRRRYRRKVEALDELAEDRLVDPVDPAQIWEGNFQQEQVRQAIRQLTPEQQQVLALRFASERSLEETAQLIGKKVNAVKALQFRALGALRRLLVGDEP